MSQYTSDVILVCVMAVAVTSIMCICLSMFVLVSSHLKFMDTLNKYDKAAKESCRFLTGTHMRGTSGPFPMFLVAIAGGVVCIVALALLVYLMTRDAESPTAGLPSTPPTFKIPAFTKMALQMFNAKTDCPQAARWARVTLMDILKELDEAVYAVNSTPTTHAKRRAALQQALTVFTVRTFQSIEEVRACKPGTTFNGETISELVQKWDANKGTMFDIKLT